METSTLLVDVDALYQWTKLFGDCICSKVCMLYSMVTDCIRSKVCMLYYPRSDSYHKELK